MKTILNTAVAGILALSTLAASVDTASANHRRHYHGRDIIVGSGLGLATGLFLGGVINSHRTPIYYYPEAVRLRAGEAHYLWCASRYRSYNPKNNTWVGYNGRVNYCDSPYAY